MSVLADPYLGAVLAGAAVGAATLGLLWRQAGLRLDARVAAICVATVLLGLLGGRAYVVLEQWRYGVTTSGWLDGGFRLPGAVLGMLIGLALGGRLLRPDVPLARVLDLGALAAQPALAVVRLGCLAAGCCFGTVSDLPWAMRFARDTQAGAVHQALHLMGPGDLTTVPVHPLAMYFLVLHLAVGAVLLWFRRRQRYDGQLVLLALLLAQGGKAALETLRQPPPAAPAGHLIAASALIAAAAAIGLLLMARRSAGRRSPTA